MELKVYYQQFGGHIHMAIFHKGSKLGDLVMDVIEFEKLNLFGAKFEFIAK